MMLSYRRETALQGALYM